MALRRILAGLLLALPLCVVAACPSLLDRKVQTIHEKEQSLCEYAGKVVLVVNTASECGYTPQYEGLEALYRRYRDRGLVVLGFPSNDFGGQEPGSNKEIASFCVNQYAIDFPMFAKSAVKGGAANPLFRDLAKATGVAPGWNFHKYVIDRAAKHVQSFDTRVDPGDPKLAAAIERLLQAKPQP